MNNQKKNEEFFRALYSQCDQGTINLRFLPPGKNRFIPLSKTALFPSILRNHRKQNSYFGVATRTNGNATKQGIEQIPAVWIDFDFKDGSPGDLQANLEDFPLKPSCVVNSGGGLHIYWFLREPAEQGDIPQIEDILRRLAVYFGGDTTATDASRIMRVPETPNLKYDPPRMAQLVELKQDLRYNPSDFENILPEIPKGEETPPPGWQDDLLPGVSKGMRNDSAARLAGRYIGKGLSSEETLSILQKWNEKNEPPLTEGELGAVVDSVAKTHQRNNPPLHPPDRKDITADGLREITPGQDFINGVSHVAVPRIIINNDKAEQIVEIITSEHERIQLTDKNLLQQGFYTKRFPNPPPRWSNKSIEGFLAEEESAPYLKDIFIQIKKQYEQYIDFLDKRVYSLVSLWTIGTYFHRLFSSYPYIHLNGDPNVGKTKTLELTALLSFNGELTFTSTPAYIIRAINDSHCTCCVDEAEKLKSTRDEERQAVISMYNAGYKRGAMAGKAEPQNKRGKWVTKRFEAYSPKMFASIKELDPVLKTRCVPFVMVESSDMKIKNSIIDSEAPHFQSIRDRLYIAMMHHHGNIRELYRGLRDNTIQGREWELWRPVLALALLIDGEERQDSDRKLYQEMRGLALEVGSEKRRQREEETSTPKLLLAFRELLNDLEEEFFTTKELKNALCKYDEEYFGWMNEESTKGRVGRFLKREIHRLVIGESTRERISGALTRGYRLNRKAIEDRLKGMGINTPIY